jgi:hypothetical protein
MRRRLIAALAVAGVLLAVPVAREWYLARTAKLGPVVAAPAEPQVSVRIGETVRFTAAAEGATGFTWLRWGRPVSFAPTWTFTAAPEDAGWQQVMVEVTGRNGLRATHTWDLGVVAPVVPEIETLDPPAGALALHAGERRSFRATAHLPAARPTDRLAFEWLMDDRPVLRDERAAEDAASELVLPPAESGAHRLRLRVTEDGRTASLADWELDVAAADVATAAAPPSEAFGPPAPPSEPAAPVRIASAPPPVEPRVVEPAARPAEPPSAPPATAVAAVPTPTPAVAPPTVNPPPPPAAPPARLVRVTPARELAASVGELVVLEARVEPDASGVAYRWSVDGRRVPSRSEGRLEYASGVPGRHTVTLVVDGGQRAIGRASWVVAVRAPERAVAPAPTAVAPPAERVAVAPTPEVVAPPAPTPPASRTLAEADVRRWLDDYARAWSRKDVDALRRMGQVRTADEAAQLTRYFRSVDDLAVAVRVIALSVAGDRASVEFERTDTVTDPSGRRQQLKLPPIRKEIERTPDGLRFARGASG